MSDLGNKKIFSENLNYYMHYYQKDRITMCHDLDIKYSTFSDWCNGKKYPRIDKIDLLSRYFHIEKSDLIEKKDFNKTPVSPTIPILKSVPYPDSSFLNPTIGSLSVSPDCNLELTDIENCYSLKMEGDSMEPVISDGDLVIIHKQETFESGNTCLFTFEPSRFLIRKIEKVQNSIKLIAFNPHYPHQVLTQEEIGSFQVLGRVRRCIKTNIFD